MLGQVAFTGESHCNNVGPQVETMLPAQVHFHGSGSSTDLGVKME